MSSVAAVLKTLYLRKMRDMKTPSNTNTPSAAHTALTADDASSDRVEQQQEYGFSVALAPISPRASADGRRASLAVELMRDVGVIDPTPEESAELKRMVLPRSNTSSGLARRHALGFWQSLVNVEVEVEREAPSEGESQDH